MPVVSRVARGQWADKQLEGLFYLPFRWVDQLPHACYGSTVVIGTARSRWEWGSPGRAPLAMTTMSYRKTCSAGTVRFTALNTVEDELLDRR